MELKLLSWSLLKGKMAANTSLLFCVIGNVKHIGITPQSSCNESSWYLTKCNTCCLNILVPNQSFIVAKIDGFFCFFFVLNNSFFFILILELAKGYSHLMKWWLIARICCHCVMGGGLNSGISINPEAGYTGEDGHSSDVGNDVPASLILHTHSAVCTHNLAMSWCRTTSWYRWRSCEIELHAGLRKKGL